MRRPPPIAARRLNPVALVPAQSRQFAVRFKLAFMAVLTNGDAKRRVVDLRSDTTTRPTKAMLDSVATAELGDDVYGEDPTVNRLQQYAAELTGKEAALFVPSGTMANLIAVLAQCGRGGEVLLGDESHIFHYEAGGVSALGGCVMHTIPTAPNGELPLSALDAAVRERPVDQHFAQPGIVCIEQTHNRLGGRVLSLEYMRSMSKWAREHGLPLHCDGARVFNAAAALGVEVSEIAQHVTMLCFCLSKGLAAPAGSLLVGPAAVIAKAHSMRKMLGGGMRQVGVLAAPGMVALRETPALLHADHKNARLLAEGVGRLPGVVINVDDVESNIVVFRLAPGSPPLSAVVDRMKQAGVLVLGFRGGIRVVTHLQVSKEDCQRAVATLEQVLLDLSDAMGKSPGDAGYVNISATAGAGYGAISY